MLRNPIDFQGLQAINLRFVQQLENYLNKKEHDCAKSIVEFFDCLSEHLPSLAVLDEEKNPTTLASVDKMIREKKSRIGIIKEPIIPRDFWTETVSQMNQAAWEYTEVLEGYVVELHQQLNRLRLDQTSTDTVDLVDKVKEMINGHLEGAYNTFVRIESELIDIRNVAVVKRSSRSKFLRFFFPGKKIFESSLFAHLRSAKRGLDEYSDEFKGRYKRYYTLVSKVKNALEKFQKYSVLLRMEEEKKESFIEVYRLLKMWTTNSRTKSVRESDIVTPLRSFSSNQDVLSLFKEYYRSLRESFFLLSRSLKERPTGEISDEIVKKIIANLKQQSSELHTLGSSVGRYREFLLRTDPNPYIRTRWGFVDSVVGTEPSEVRRFLKLAFDVESLDTLLWKLIEALQENPLLRKEIKKTPLHSEIQSTLHDMGQPLMSKNVLRRRAENLVELLEQCEELSSPHSSDVETVDRLLSKALRCDWKDHLLHENPLFHQVYSIHRGIIGDIEDDQHRLVMKELKELNQLIDEWAKCGRDHAKLSNIEKKLDIIPDLVQEWSESIQAPEEENKHQLFTRKRHQLLEFRYLFGKGSNVVLQKELDHVRNLCVEVEQSFEVGEDKLLELLRMW